MLQTEHHRIRLIILALILILVLIPLTQVSAQTHVFINEIHYDNSSTDVNEAIEIAGPAGTDLAGWSIVLYNGSGGAVYDTTALSGVIPDQDDGYGTLVFTYPANGIQNGAPDGIALVAPGGIVQFLSYEGTFTAVGGPADGLESADIGVQEGSSTPVGDSLQLTGAGTSYEDFAWNAPAASSYGAVNAGQSFGGGVTPPDVLINEVDSDTPSTDSLEFVELYDGGMGNTALDGAVVVLYNGNGDTVYEAFDLDGYATDADGYFVIGSVAGADLYVDPGSSGWLQNGADAVTVYAGDGADFPDGAAVTTDGLVDAIVYDTDDADDAGLLVLLNAGQPQVNEDEAGDKDAHSNQRCPNGAGGALNTDSYQQYPPTPGAENTCGGSPDYTPIYDIQYTTDPAGDSPLTGQTDITTEGIVAARFQYGYFIQDPAAGPWSGLWVYDTANTPALGDRVRLTGTVAEYYNLTELASLSGYQIVSSGNPLPDAAVLATGDVSQEQWEGVLVRVESVTVGDEDLGNGEWSVDDGTGDVIIDDKGNYTYTPVNGEALAAVTGPLDYSYGAFKIQPRDDSDIVLPIPPSTLVINEFLADPAGDLTGDANGDGVRDSSDDEFVEIVNDSDDDIDVSGWTLADGYGVRHTFPVGTIVSARCAIVVFGGGTPTGEFGGTVVQTASTGALGLNNDGDTIALSDGSTEQTVVAYGSEGGNDQSLTRAPDVTGFFVLHATATGSGEALFSPGTQIDGTQFAGCGPIFGACGDAATFVHEVQGSGPDSPLNGTPDVVIEGIVVGDFQDTATQLRGFFVQEEDADADADPATSEGVFVYDSGFGVDVVVGDVVRVQGDVVEYYGLTELNSVSNLAVCDTGAIATAAVVSLPVPDLAQWETYEGMLVTIPQALYATDNYNQGRYGEVSLSVDARLAAPTNVASPGTDALALQDLNDRSRVLLDDGSNLENPLPLPPYLGDDDTLRAGDTVPGLAGVLAYGFSSYRIHPTQPVVFTRVNGRTAAPQPVGGRLKVASFNVLNYFNGDGTGGGFPTPRGADTLDEFIRQRDKIVSAVLALDADVVGLIEIENDGYSPDSAIADLVNGLNDVTGPGTYAYVDPGVSQIGTDEIAVGFVYKPAAVTPVGASAILDSSVDPTFIDTMNRPALAQTFEENATGERFTAVANHFKSKSSRCDDIGDPDLGDGQGNCPATRTSAAIALTNWLVSDPTASGDPDFLIIGDLNSYAMEDPVAVIEDAGYTNLVETFVGPDAYSYVYYGQAGYLDHALTNPSLSAQVTGATVWHANSDEPSALDYNNYNQPALYNPDPYRSSDHDPVLVGLDLFSAKPLEDVSAQFATIHWMPFGDGQARFRLTGEFDLPAGFTRGDLSRDLTLCVTIADETGCDTVAFTRHGSAWLYRGADGEGSGMDISRAVIVWPPGRAAIVIVMGKLTLPGVDENTTPAEATVAFSLPVETSGSTPELSGKVFVAFETCKRLWFYRDR
jgi:predicted extracellular nuclease